MDSVKPSSVTPNKSKLARTFAKVLHIRTLTGITPGGIQKVQTQEKVRDGLTASKSTGSRSESFASSDDEFQNRAELDALLAKLFASISSIKAAYAEIQYAQSPFDPDGIQVADEMVVKELKSLSELKRCYVKRQFDPSPETTMLLAEIQEQKSVMKTYEITGKKLESQGLLKDSEFIFLKEKLDEASKQNRLLEKRLNQSGPLSTLDNLHLSGLSPSHFIKVLRHANRAIRSFVRLMMDEMKSANWDINVAATAIEPDVFYCREDHKCFAFEAFVCRELFDSFHYPNFSLPNESLPDKNKLQKLFFGRFMELKSVKAKEFLAQKHRSTFANFCRVKYLRLIHPRMESSFFGNLSQRAVLNSGQVPDSNFFTSFAEMAKWVWLLHCLAFSFEPEGSIFQVQKGCRFSDVYMESITDEVFLSTDSDPFVAFTVVPGFKIGKTVIQCQVYLSQLQPKARNAPRKLR